MRSSQSSELQNAGKPSVNQPAASGCNAKQGHMPCDADSMLARRSSDQEMHQVFKPPHLQDAVKSHAPMDFGTFDFMCNGHLMEQKHRSQPGDCPLDDCLRAARASPRK